MKDFAIETARKAGEYLLENFRKAESSRRGSPKEVTTTYDKEANRIILDAIAEKYPDHDIVTEESEGVKEGSDYTWIIDPLDGTANYANGNPFFSVSIALMHKDELIVGVVYAPFLGEMYSAERGKGAFLNGKPIKVSEVESLTGAYVTACEGGDPGKEKLSKIATNLYSKVKDFRKFGSAAIEGCFVACGRVEAYATVKICSWDIAGAVLIVQEAGGKVTAFDGSSWKPEQGDYVLSNGKVHDEMLEMVK